MAGKTIKYATYERSTALIKDRFAKINALVEQIAKDAIDNPLTPVKIRTLNTYLSEVKKKRSDYEGNFHRILESSTIEEAPHATLAKDQDEINDSFVNISCLIESLIPMEDPHTPSADSVVSSVHFPAASHVKLPKLSLKTFDGNAANWVSFINLFDSSVHHNASLSAVMKMQYLLSVLSHEPLSLVSSLNITATNYAIAYNLLRTRYHNTRRLTVLHLNAILDLPNVTVGATKTLRNFVNLFFEHTQALKALNCDIVTQVNPLLSAHLLRKLDQDLRRKLEVFRKSLDDEPHTLPKVNDILDFLNEEYSQTEDASLHLQGSSTKANYGQPYKASFKGLTEPKKETFKRNVALHTASTSKTTSMSDRSPSQGHQGQQSKPCFACQQVGHKVYGCILFKNKTPQERYQLVKAKNRCISCLGSHDLKSCNSKSTCLKCQKKHHTLLHFEKGTNPSRSNSPKHHSSSCSPQKEDMVVTLAHKSNQLKYDNYTVLLGTALVKLTAPNGNSYVFRALLDSGSMLNFISESAFQLLGGPRQKSSLHISGISHTSSQTKGHLDLKVSSLSDHHIAYQEGFHILDKISANLPRTRLSPEVLAKVKPYILADPTFYLPGPVDVLLGGSLFPHLFKNEVHRLGHNLPSMVGTHLGYIVMGTAPCSSNETPSTHVMSLLSTSDHDLHATVQRFWQQEEVPVCSKKTEQEQLCDQHFAATHNRDKEGRYIVRLPFKENYSSLGSSRLAAERRFYSLERKFIAQSRFSILYHDFMKEYLSLGHMVKGHDLDLTVPHYFLPHHGVVKENSSTTKLRTVFDASSKSSTGVSLNDILFTGPKLQTNICDIILYFRSHKIVFSCDIRQMYRQIKIHPSDQAYQLILWRNAPDQEIGIYQLTTVTYGLNSSPYLAIKTLHQLADDEGDHFLSAAHVLRTQTYVDDIITGADTEDEALRLQEQLISLLRRGGFELRKWVSNSPRLLQALPEEHLESPVFLQESNQPQFSILGLQWSPSSDCFSYNPNIPLDGRPTKRTVLSLIAKIYDPCGFLAPCIMLAKCFMQFLWTIGLTWDEPLQPEHAEKWHYFVTDAKNLAEISIPRAFQFSDSNSLELHGFADASESGYAAIVYFRSHLSNGDIIVRPILAKTRVAPLKRVTLPRLELCAVHLLAHLVSHCMTIFKDRISSENIYLWSDSSVVLTWLRTPPYRLKTFVANRVSQVQELIQPEAWRHVSSGDNPADCASRGIYASQLVDHPLWWTGPSWLQLPHTEWPSAQITEINISSSDECKQTPLTVLISTHPEEWNLLSRFSSWCKLQRIMAYVQRFIKNCRTNERNFGPLQLCELNSAKKKIFWLVQQSTFSEDIAFLHKKRDCSLKLRRLRPFLDWEGLLRVGGRLSSAALTQDVRHPVILPKTHHVTSLLIDYYHVSNLHAGSQLTQALLAQEVWILSARSAIRSRIFKCFTCFRHKPRHTTPLMGDLPVSRVTPARPFLSTGIDYAGPLTAKVLNLRSVKHIKTYLCIFICMVTKAVHLEVVTDLTTEAFIAALTRFVSRRGLCADIYSDCGTNFVGADATLRRVIQDLNQNQVQDFTAAKGIRFHFNPPAAPHQGGLWESAVKSAKHHLRRVMGETVLTLQELMTLTIQVEAMLNSRPLTPISSDPNDFSALSPGHFLIGAPLTAVPEHDLHDIPSNRLKQWQLIQAFSQRIWKRWHLEYIHTLQQRSKWNRDCENLKIGDLVLIHTPSSPLSWPLARITQIHPGCDGIVRVVDLKTANGSFTRPTVKVCPLPINN